MQDLGRAETDLWIFGYGSLMWHPGFPFAEAIPARLTGYHRAFCIYSMHYRGTPARPGLILGLDRGSACVGIAFRIAAPDAAAVRHYVRTRELVTGVYREVSVPVTLLDTGRTDVMAMTFIAERQHPAYAGDLGLARQVRVVRKAKGLTGYNLDYVLNTACHLVNLGIRERRIERLVALLGPHLTTPCPNSKPGVFVVRAERTRALATNATGRPERVRAARIRIGDRKRFLFRRAISSRYEPPPVD